MRGVPGSSITRTDTQRVAAAGELARGRAGEAVTARVARRFARVAQVGRVAGRHLVPTIATRLALLQIGTAALVAGQRRAAHHVAAAVFVQAVQARIGERTWAVRIRERAVAQIIGGAGGLSGPTGGRRTMLEYVAVTTQRVRRTLRQAAGVLSAVAILAIGTGRDGIPRREIGRALLEILAKASVGVGRFAGRGDATRARRLTERGRGARHVVFVAGAVGFALL